MSSSSTPKLEVLVKKAGLPVRGYMFPFLYVMDKLFKYNHFGSRSWLGAGQAGCAS